MRLLLFIILTLSINKSCLAQKELSDNEIQYFFSLIKKTINYQALQQKADSFNRDPNNIPQEVKVEMLKRSTGAERDDYIFYATICRQLTIGLGIETYLVTYSKLKKQIVSVKKYENQLEIKK